ncbi:MAG: PUR family DNA/RNA-binding protein [Saprospiraceae bacterium]|nr:PUR family DNA/RNA-binding protein [Saprospiraceae bacterium]
MDHNSQYDSVFTKKVKAGRRRTYFLDVRQTKGEDFYLTITESTKKFNGSGYERHKIFLYKEDFNRFLESLTETIDHVKTELLPDYDFDEYTRKNQEWEEKRKEEARLAEEAANAETTPEIDAPSTPAEEPTEAPAKEVDSEEDMEW